MPRFTTSPRIVRALKAWCSAVLVVGLAWLVWPASLGGEVTFVMVSGTSMEPRMHTGDLVLVRERDGYEVGEGSIVIHRIVGGDADTGFVTQGDNRDRPDTWHPTGADVVGERHVFVAGAGNWLARLRNPLPLAYLAGAMTLVAMLLPTKKERDARKRVEHAPEPASAQAEAVVRAPAAPVPPTNASTPPPSGRPVRVRSVAPVATLGALLLLSTRLPRGRGLRRLP